jgi:hypothetical protein
MSNIPNWPVPLDVEKDLPATIIVSQLCLEEVGQILNQIHLGLLDVLHPPEDVFTRFLVFSLLCPEFFLDAEILLLRFLHLG